MLRNIVLLKKFRGRDFNSSYPILLPKKPAVGVASETINFCCVLFFDVRYQYQYLNLFILTK